MKWKVLGLAAALAFARAPDAAATPAVARAPGATGADAAALGVTSASWDSLARLEGARRWAASESLATSLVVRLERAPGPDSLDYSRALLSVSNALLKRRLFGDPRTFGWLERGIGIRERHAPPGDNMLARALTSGAFLYPEAGEPALARSHAERAMSLLRAASPVDTALFASATQALAVALEALGREDEARAAFGDALRLREAKVGRDDRSLVPPIAEFGSFLSRIGEFDLARELLLRAVGIGARDTLPGSDMLEGSLARLSTLERRVGNLAESVDLAQRAYELARQRVGESGIATLRWRTMLAYRLEDIGDPHAAVPHLQAIVPLMERGLGSTNSQTLNARLSLLDALIATGDTTTAQHELATLRPAIATQQALANDNGPYFRQLVADLEIARGHAAAARETLEVAIGIERPKGNPIGATLAGLYTRELETLRDSSGRAFADRVFVGIERLRDSTRVRTTPEWISLVSARASAEARIGMRDSAWVHALEAERMAYERLEYQLHALPDERALQLAQQLGSPCDALVNLARPSEETEIATAWDRIVRWRGLVRHEIARRHLPEVVGGDTSLVAAHARWLGAQRRLAQLVVSGTAHPDDSTSAARFSAARGEAEDAERHYVMASSGYVTPDPPVTLELVLAQLEPGQALIAFATASIDPANRTLGAFIATAGERRPRYVELGPATEIRRDIRAWVEHLGTPPADPRAARAAERECRKLGLVVRERVWNPIAKSIGDTREAIIVPEGAVLELPWMALPGEGKSYLAEARLEIRVRNAERDLLPATDAEHGRGLLALGGPDFERAGEATPDAAPTDRGPVAALTRARTWPCGGNEAVALAALPAARAEAEEIAARWPAQAGAARVLVGADATEAEFKRDAPGHAVIHVATHGVMVADTCVAGAGARRQIADAEPVTRGVGGVEPVGHAKQGHKAGAKSGAHSGASTASPPAASTASPSASSTTAPPPAPASPATPWLVRQVWLALAGANRPAEARGENEGLLTAEEVVTLDLRGTDWVVLSACQSGVAAAWEREGLLGMRRAFHLAGAHSVIASQWPIADQATREWMAVLYTERARGATACAAVHGACRAMVAARRHDGRPTHPFYWAAFTASEE